MSSILKALQKLEQDKAARRKRAPDITGDIAKPAAARQRPSWLIPAVVVGVALLAVVVTYAVMKGLSRPRQTPVATLPPAAVKPEKVAPPPPSATLPPVEVIQPLPIPRSGERDVTPPVAPPPPARKVVPQPAPVPPAKTAPQPAPPAMPQVPARSEEPVAAAAPTQLPALKVTGIAWQKDNSSRFAVINGSTLMEGGSVEGARVEEIYPDRVRFSMGKRSFEVPLGKSSADR